MKNLLNAMAIIGAVIMIVAISTSDYYTTELVRTEPMYVWKMIWAGFGMMMPTLANFIWSEYEGRKHNVHR